jgi:hypothetical protein
MIVVSYLLGQRHQERETGLPFESGIATTGSARVRLSAKFYLVAAGASSRLWFLVIILVIASAIGVFYYLRVLVALYGTPPPGERVSTLRTARGEPELRGFFMRAALTRASSASAAGCE